ncbi:MAG TPA: hypothetical protein VG435_00125 [Acidimicrobiales bacterium]|nr:hypothetical protein [Acidimicrobiales bacterium]
MTRTLAAGAVAAVAAGLVLPIGSAHASSVQAASTGLAVSRVWSTSFPNTGVTKGSGPTIGSSPAIVQLASGPAVVFGDTKGKIWALNLSNGAIVPGWPASSTNSAPIDSSPSAYGSTVFIGSGDYASPNSGGYQAIASNPTQSWSRTVEAIWQTGNPKSAVYGGLTVAKLQGSPSVFAGSLGQDADAFRAAGGAQLGGFPYLQYDSNQTTAAAADLYQNGQTEIVEGGAQTGNAAMHIANGGHIRVISQTGATVCDYHASQPVSGSPAVGEFLGNHQVGIVAGTVPLYANQGGADQAVAVNSHCAPVWATTLDGLVDSASAVVNALNNGGLQVAVTAHNAANTSGTTYLLDGPTGRVIWSAPTMGAAPGGPVSVDLGGGYQDLVVAGTQGTQILDGRTGRVIWSVASSNGSVPMTQNSALVTDDANGRVGITLVGYNANPYDTQAIHYEVAGSNGSRVTEAGGWPEFHHDPQLTGDAGTPAPSIEVPCTAPRVANGYYMAASDGGIFNYGLPFCGSTGNVALAKPIVAMAATPNGGGYWLVASDGGVFAFGNAKFYGSTGGVRLAQPIVGMAATSDGKGYYLVASDGGVFAFGDARFYGSTGGVRLAKPIVAMATNPRGGGYWMVASDGGVFSFGSSKFRGSTGGHPLAKPVVGLAATSTGLGYWMVASDGGIFNYGDAHFHGSTGNVALNKPIVAIARTTDSGGYWMVASDGGVFAFGDAHFHGSTGGVPLNKPVVAMSALGD